LLASLLASYIYTWRFAAEEEKEKKEKKLQ
jgi:hypothetical protein